MIASNKTKGLLLKGKLRGRPPAIKLCGHKIHFLPQVQYLRVTRDNNLTFLSHVRHTGNKSKARFGKIIRFIRIKYGVKISKLNFLYKTVFLPIISYGYRAWRDRVDHFHITKYLKGTQRQILLNIIVTYRTTSLQDLCVITANHPQPIKLKQDEELGMLRRDRRLAMVEDRLRMETPTELKTRYTAYWQQYWTNFDNGRYTYALIPNIEDGSPHCTTYKSRGT